MDAMMVTTDEELQTGLLGSAQEATTVDADGNLRIEVMDTTWTKGEVQPNQYRDWPFALLFVAQLIGVVFFAVAWGIPAAFQDHGNNDSPYHPYDNDNEVEVSGMLSLSMVSSFASLGILAVMLAGMTKLSGHLIHVVLGGSVVVSLLLAVGFFTQGYTWMAFLYLFVAAMGVCYYVLVRHRIPFAKSVLVTAVTAIESNLGVAGVALALVVVFVVFVGLWILSFLGVVAHQSACESGGDCHVPGVITVAYLFFFLWAAEIFKNVTVCTVAGVVGTWWFAPQDANEFCSVCICDSLKRATTYSFGSICMGSLLAALVQLLRQLIHHARRQNSNNSLLLCVLECLVACLESIVEYFNKWNMIYIGLYGYDYLGSGRKVIELFRERGWTNIINDNLIARVLMLMKLIVAGLSGGVGMMMASLHPDWEHPSWVGGLVPFIIGFALSHVVMGVIAAAADTTVVCFAESPNDFRINHAELFAQMSSAWRQFYPDEYGLN